MRPTPETDAFFVNHKGTVADMAVDALSLCRAMERQRDEAREKLALKESAHEVTLRLCARYKREADETAEELEEAHRDVNKARQRNRELMKERDEAILIANELRTQNGLSEFYSMKDQRDRLAAALAAIATMKGGAQ